MKLKQTLHNLALIACMTSALLPMPTGATTLQSGDLIKGPGDAVYYYGEDGKRYVFPNLKTYQTWYNDFTGVKALSLDELQAISLAKNVTYKPGVRMIKVESIPKVYAVAANGTLRWITTEDLAESLYGADWNKKIDDLPDGFFVDYKIGAPIVAVADFAPATESASASTINFNLKLTGTPTTPTDTPTSTTPTEPTTPPTAFDFSVSKTNAMAGEIITLSASAPSVGAISKIELFIDTTLIKSCNAVTACSSDYQIPPANTAESYTAKAIVTKLDAQVLMESRDITTKQDGSDKVIVRLDRRQIKPNQYLGVTVDVSQDVGIGRINVVVDGQTVGSCVDGAHICKWAGTIMNQTLGTVHEVIAQVGSYYGTIYTSSPAYVTVSENDEPSITVSPAKDSIYLGEKLDVTVSASDDDGILSIDVMKDGAVLKHCEGAAPCTVSTGPWNTTGTLTFSGKATDALYKTAENTSSPVSVVAQP